MPSFAAVGESVLRTHNASSRQGVLLPDDSMNGDVATAANTHIHTQKPWINACVLLSQCKHKLKAMDVP